MNEKINKLQAYYFVALMLIPLLIAGLYALSMTIHARFRYDRTYFTPEYAQKYPSPGEVARTLETVLREGDEQTYAALTGLRREPPDLAPQPRISLSILIDVDERDYFHYLYFNTETFRRSTYFVKEIENRWVVAPEDLYFYFDSGQWTKVFMPVAITWWILWLVVAVARLLYLAGARTRWEHGR
mgnify:FL=1